MDILTSVMKVVIYLVFFKAVFIGSDFSFIKWFRFGRRYLTWYRNRPKFHGEKNENTTSEKLVESY